MGAVAGCEEEKGKRKQFGPRRHSTSEWPGAGRGRQAQGSRSKQGREELSIEVVVVESSSALSVRVLFIVIEVVSTSPLAVPAFQRSHCLFGVWMRA